MNHSVYWRTSAWNFLSGSVLVLTLVVKMGVLTAWAESATKFSEPINLDGYRQLFVDDHVIARMQGVERVLHQPQKHPANPLVKAEQPSEGNLVYLYGSVARDQQQDIFKMWYQGYELQSPVRGHYATSKDGIHWDKPQLGLLDFKGSKSNNRIAWFGMGMIHSPDDPDPNKRYKSLAGRRGQVSADGLSWETPAGSKAIPGDLAGDNVIPYCYDELSRRYVAFPKVVRKSHGHYRRSVSVSFSDDFLTWTKAKTILVPDDRDDELTRKRIPELVDHVAHDFGPEWHLAQFYGMAGFPYEGMYLGMLWVLDVSGLCKAHPTQKVGGGGEDGPVYVELTSSRDLLNWDRVCDRDIFLPVGETDAWDQAVIYTVNRPVIVGDEIWIYYGASWFSHAHPICKTKTGPLLDRMVAAAKIRSKRGLLGGIGLATLRLDGWVSMDAGANGGTITTKRLSFDGNRLIINAVSDDGEVLVEVLDENGEPIPGFAKTDCDIFKGDAIRHPVTWGGNADVSRLAGKVIRIRFHLRDAKLYSFVFGGA